MERLVNDTTDLIEIGPGPRCRHLNKKLHFAMRHVREIVLIFTHERPQIVMKAFGIRHGTPGPKRNQPQLTFRHSDPYRVGGMINIHYNCGSGRRRLKGEYPWRSLYGGKTGSCGVERRARRNVQKLTANRRCNAAPDLALKQQLKGNYA